MDIHILLNELLENCDWTKEKILYVSNIIEVCEKLNKYPQLREITISDLEYSHLSEVRLIAKCFTIFNIHHFTKQALIEMIRIKYNKLIQFGESTTTQNTNNDDILFET